ncbi:hypothetical protein LO762_08765 [Actinocorallia sp. API 0066]|uniref:hypothetical protein n=1 Tax=Actinocorallia sp. API 0066 TaxID=2896846 RepID=UPI001E306B13|nr:hypothetical protein [Actinocorallia sp. API 0066]MCD0449277.1 hypothetical protein [Actinocorallia sp. API 0066]
MGRAVPFTYVEELNRVFDTSEEPNVVHVELRPLAPLDAARLRYAVQEVAAHPLVRRRAVGSGWLRRPRWVDPGGPDVDPLERVGWRDEADLARLRDGLLSAPLPTTAGPLFRVTHAVGPGGDVVVLRAHHAAYDGIATLDLMNTITRVYRGLPTEIALARAVPRTAAAQAASSSAPRPVRIAPEGGTPGRPGSGAVLVSTEVPRSASGTVNDVMVAALARTVRRWNAARGAAEGAVRVTVPVNTRPRADWWRGFGNSSRLTTVSAEPSSDGAALIADVAAQMAAGKAVVGPPVSWQLRVLTGPWAPSATRRRVMTTLRRLTGERLADTVLLSNLGLPPDPPRFGPDPEPLWFSAPAALPRGLSVSAVTTANRLHLCFRYRHPLFDHPAATSFATAYLTALSSLTTAPNPH